MWALAEGAPSSLDPDLLTRVGGGARGVGGGGMESGEAGWGPGRAVRTRASCTHLRAPLPLACPKALLDLWLSLGPFFLWSLPLMSALLFFFF